MSLEIQFILNEREISARVPAGLLVLDYLRNHLRLVGTKEGCKEGDCGACVVMVGELNGKRVRYRPVTSCLMPMAELHGKHLITIEGLRVPGLSPVQQAIVELGASQCGFCTPGIVVSLTSYLMQEGIRISREGVKEALSGHLCRCTGYRSLKDSADFLSAAVGNRTGISAMVQSGFLPEFFLHIAERLKAIPALPVKNGRRTPDFLIAGGTDIYVQQGDTLPEARVTVLNQNPQLKGIRKVNGYLKVGATTTFEDFANHPAVQKTFPDIKKYMFLIASLQIRHRATLGGNIVNASPIGDMTILLLALDTRLLLKKGNRSRMVPLRSFYKGYKKLDLVPGELLTEIRLPDPPADSRIHWEKVSKRTCLDIASVNSAIQVQCDSSGRIRSIGLAMGGVAPIPLFMKKTCEFLTNKTVNAQNLRKALAIAQGEISPISDIRGSADYKRLLANHLLVSHFNTLFPQQINVREYYEAS